jgi:flagellar basal-body rod modification protein FlgD
MIDAVSGNAVPQGLGVAVNAAADLKMDFLRLLTTQLANQDPLSPMDNEAMVQQLATFSQLEQLEGINQRLETSMQYSQSLNNTMMMEIVGKRVTVLGNDVQVKDGAPSRTLVRTVEAGVGIARVYDAEGKLVRSVDGIQLQPGFNEIEWDGKGEDGEPLPDGAYTIKVTGEKVGGGFMGVATFQSGIVDTVQFDDDFVSLMVNGKFYSPAAVVEVGLGSTSAAIPPASASHAWSGLLSTSEGDPGVPSSPSWRAPWAALRGIR